MDDIQHDRVLCDCERDPPQQDCLYIPPGCHAKEVYRLGTFEQFPADAPVSKTDLAAAGFYYTGYEDRVKCFSCGSSVENWMAGDEPNDRKWHKADCDMKNRGDQSGNVPISNFRNLLRQFTGNIEAMRQTALPSAEMKSYAESPQAGPSETPAQPETQLPSGFANSVVSNFRRIHLGDSLPNLAFAEVLSADHEALLKSLNLRSEADRRKTFLKWPSCAAPILPNDLARDGFFYLGDLDRTKCFSCSGVLHNWAPHDNVRKRHEAHYPSCRIVRQRDSGNIPLSEEHRRAFISARSTDSNMRSAYQRTASREQRHLADDFPREGAFNTHLKQLRERIEALADEWQRDGIRLYHEGKLNTRMSFGQDGAGQLNRRSYDDRWTEHAGRFPRLVDASFGGSCNPVFCLLADVVNIL